MLDHGQEGTAVFSPSALSRDLVPGIVRFDGLTVDIDLSSVSSLDQARLLFQLIDGNRSSESTIRVSNVCFGDEAATGIVPFSADGDLVREPGPALVTDSLQRSGEVAIDVENVRLDPLSGRYSAELRLRTTAVGLGRNIAVTFPELPVGVSLLNPSGTTPANDPWETRFVVV